MRIVNPVFLLILNVYMYFVFICFVQLNFMFPIVEYMYWDVTNINEDVASR